MSGSTPFIVVGENIHCTLVYKTTGAFVKSTAEGAFLRYTEGGKERLVPIPPRFTQSEEWSKGNVKHAAVAMWLGLHGEAALKTAGADYIRSLARKQADSGAAYLDLNVDELSTDLEERKAAIRWAAGVIQGSTKLPLSIDSSNIDILRAGLAACDGARGKPMVNSVSLERLAAVDVAREAGAVVLAGATGETSMPADVAQRLANHEKLVGILENAGFARGEIYLDPLVFPVSVNPSNGLYVIECIRELRSRYGAQIHFAPGLSNISYGMPNRKLLNQVYTRLCRDAGMDGAIANPLHVNASILDALDTQSEAYRLARAFLMAEDQYGMEYIAASREGKV